MRAAYDGRAGPVKISLSSAQGETIMSRPGQGLSFVEDYAMAVDSNDERQFLVRSLRQQLESLVRAGLDRVPAPPSTAGSSAPAVERSSHRSIPPAHEPGAVKSAGDDVGDAGGVAHAPTKAEPAAAAPIAISPTGLPVLPPPSLAVLFGSSGFDQPPVPACDRPAMLAALAREVSVCRRCPHLAETRTQTVFGTGNAETRLMFIGEAPGADEDRMGEPFVGRAGQLLTDMITKGMGLSRDQVYIANILKCRPPENRTPTNRRGGQLLPLPGTADRHHPARVSLPARPRRRSSRLEYDPVHGKNARQMAPLSRNPHPRHLPPFLSAQDAIGQERCLGRLANAHERDGDCADLPISSSSLSVERTANYCLCFAATTARGGIGDVGGGESVLFEQGVGCAAFTELVAEVDEADRDRVNLGDGHGDDASQAAVGQVFLGDDESAGLASGGLECVAIDRLDGVHVEHSRGDSFVGQRLGRVEGGGDHQAVGDDGQVGPIAKQRWPCRS